MKFIRAGHLDRPGLWLLVCTALCLTACTSSPLAPESRDSFVPEDRETISDVFDNAESELEGDLFSLVVDTDA